MNEIIKNIEAAQLKAEVPAFNVGDTVKVYAKIKEGNRERIQVFEGTVLKKQGGSVRATFTVRKNSNGIGVEKTWPVHSPFVEKMGENSKSTPQGKSSAACLNRRCAYSTYSFRLAGRPFISSAFLAYFSAVLPRTA